MPDRIEVVEVSPETRTWGHDMQNGPFVQYRVKVKVDGTDHPETVEWSRKPSSPVPFVGQRGECRLEPPRNEGYPRRIKDFQATESRQAQTAIAGMEREAQARGGGSQWSQEDRNAFEAKDRRITRQHSQEMAIRALGDGFAANATGEAAQKWVDDWTEHFYRDAMAAGDSATTEHEQEMVDRAREEFDATPVDEQNRELVERDPGPVAPLPNEDVEPARF